MTTQQQASTGPTRLMSLADAAGQLHVSVKTLRRRISDGTITGYRIGRLVRVDLEDIVGHLIEIPAARNPRR